jgi:hypothetical protein
MRISTGAPNLLNILSKNVATLALSLQPRQGLAGMWAKKETQESHFMLPGVQKNVKE